MIKTHWRKLTNPDYLGAYSLENGQDMILTIAAVKEEAVTGTEGKTSNCVVCYFAEFGVKPMILNHTNLKTITKLYNTPYVEDWKGKRIQIYSKRVKAFGEIVDALRIRDFIPDNQTQAFYCAVCKKEITPALRMSARQLSEYTARKYGKAMCAACATEAARESETNEADE